MYFYRIEVYHLFTEPTYMIMSHKYYFDNHQLNTFDLRYLDTISAEQKYLDNIAVINIKKEVYE